MPPLRRIDSAAVVPALEGVPAAELAASFALCREITRRSARNFYYGLRLTPEPRRSAVYAIYAWMRCADDLVDEPGPLELRRSALNELEKRTEAILAGDTAACPREGFWPAFVATIRSYPIDPQCIRDMIAGLREDLDHVGYATMADLDRYCYRVASTVGIVCIAIWGTRAGVDQRIAREKAIARGLAFQLTNILRDVAHDFDENPRRVYIPRDVLQKHALAPEALRAWSPPAACRALVAELAALAQSRYDQSAGLEDLIDPPCAPAMWGMTRIYSGLLRAIVADPARVVGPGRVRLSSVTKSLIAVRALVRSKVAARSAHRGEPFSS